MYLREIVRNEYEDLVEQIAKNIASIYVKGLYNLGAQIIFV